MNPRKKDKAGAEEPADSFEWAEETVVEDLETAEDTDQMMRGTLARRMAARRSIEDYLAERALAKELNDVLS